jgi:hypothetical protein
MFLGVITFMVMLKIKIKCPYFSELPIKVLTN